jgi:hypothetical protein
VVSGSQLTRVLIDGGSGLNLLFASTLKKMGLDISKMLTPSKPPFYGIVLGNATTPIGSVTLPVTFGTKENYCTGYIKFEVADFIPRHPRQACLGQIHGRAPLCLPAPQDARQDRGTHFSWRLEEVTRLRPRSNRVCLDLACATTFIRSLRSHTIALPVEDGDPDQEVKPDHGATQHQRHQHEDHPTVGG